MTARRLRSLLYDFVDVFVCPHVQSESGSTATIRDKRGLAYTQANRIQSVPTLSTCMRELSRQSKLLHAWTMNERTGLRRITISDMSLKEYKSHGISPRVELQVEEYLHVNF